MRQTSRRIYNAEGFRFKPFSRRQKIVLTWWQEQSAFRDYDGIICDGSIRSGKTMTMSLSFVMWAMSNFVERNFGLCGKTIGSLRRNMINDLKRMLDARGYQVEDKRSVNMLVISHAGRTNYFYMFGGTNEASQDLIQGVTLAGVLMDEAALMPESFVNQATGRCSVEGAKLWFNCNPAGSRLHWFKTNWINAAGSGSKKLLYLHFTMADNLSLSEKTKARYSSMYSGVFYRRYVMGLWVQAEGLVYPMFDAEKHLVSDEWQPLRNHRYYVAVDYGTVNPFAAGLFDFDPVNKRATMIRELYYRGGTEKRVDNEAYYKMLRELIGDFPIEYIIIDPSASSMIETIQKYNEFVAVKANNDVLNGIQDVTKFLNLGALFFDESCVETVKEFETYAWDSKSVGKDAVIKENDHSMDAIRYFCRTALRSELKWTV